MELMNGDLLMLQLEAFVILLNVSAALIGRRLQLYRHLLCLLKRRGDVSCIKCVVSSFYINSGCIRTGTAKTQRVVV